MYVYGSRVSCGVYELVDVGNRPSKEKYKKVMINHFGTTDGLGAIFIASVPAHWKKSVKLLKSEGFIQPTRKITNPNSGNKIVILVKNFSEKERKKYIASYRGYITHTY